MRPIGSASDTPRRTQHERSATTRGLLLDSTIRCLVEDGYSGTTTTRIAELAGVSRGAQVHHFHTRAELVAEAVEHVAARRAAELLQETGELPDGRERVPAALDLIWHSHSGDLFQAALELWVAARTDDELRVALSRTERVLEEHILAFCRRLFGAAGDDPDFDASMGVALDAMRGLAVLRALDDDAPEAQWPGVRERLIDLFHNTQPREDSTR